VPEEQLLERGWMADQAPDPELSEPTNGRVEVIGVDLEAHMGAVDVEVVDTLEVG
jgi:hypothetical protein